jgi:hypothetical protein
VQLDPKLSPKSASYTLWSIQALLAALFLFAGGFKLMISAETLAHVAPFPVWFLRFIAVCELAGAMGLLLPGLLRIRTVLTPLAAAGLVVIMIGATVVTLATQGAGEALLPLLAGILAAVVAYGRWRVAPIPSVARTARRHDRPEPHAPGLR